MSILKEGECWVDSTYVEEIEKELRRTKRALQTSLHALWLARAMRANDNVLWYEITEETEKYFKWKWVERKCREYAERFK